MKKGNICALIAVRSGSKRVPNKNIRKFANSNLLEIKLKQVKKIKGIKSLYVSSDDDRMLLLAKKHGAIALKRDPFYASDKVPMSEVYVHLANSINCDHIAYLNVTNPLLKIETLQRCIDTYKNLDSEFDSLATVHKIKEYMWLNGEPINYDPTNHPRSQDLPNICALNFAASILPKTVMINNRNIVGDNFYNYFIEQEESIDVDTILDFSIAEFIYKNKI